MAEENRSLILKAALSLFASHGFESTGIQAVCEASHITKPTLYHYFGSKDGLLEAVFREEGQPLLEGLGASLEYKRDLTKHLEDAAFFYREFAQKNPQFIRFWLGLIWTAPQSRGFQVSQKFGAGLHGLFLDFFHKAIPEHGNLRGKEGLLAASFAGQLNTWVGLAFAKPSELLPEEIRAFVKLFIHGIYS